MSSSARTTANQRNAQNSTGPKTQKGKDASRGNALKHGLTAKVFDLLPGEDQAEFDGRIDLFVDDHPNITATQMILIKRIVSADWKLDRLDQAQVATITQKMRHAAMDHEVELRKHAEEIGQRLIFEPLDRGEPAEWREPIVQERIARRNSDHPEVLKLELERSAEGVDWLLDRWGQMRSMLRFYGYLHYPEKFTLIRLLGKTPADMLEDRLVGTIFVACRMLHVHPWDLQDECLQAKFGVVGKPFFQRQVDHLEKEVKDRLFPPNDYVKPFEWLDDLIQQQIDALTSLRDEILQPIAEADRMEAVLRAKFDASPAGLAMTRYQGALTRDLHRSINDLMKQRKCDEAFGDVLEAVERTEKPAETPVEPPVPAAERVVLRNEPIPQVKANPAVTKLESQMGPDPARPTSYVHVSASRNESLDGGKGSKTDPKPPR